MKTIDHPLLKDLAFIAKVRLVCARLQIPDYRMLLAVMHFESDLNPACVNRIGATGLIQWLPSTAIDEGTTCADLARMSAVHQMCYVEKYLHRFTGRLNTIDDLYMAILWPAAVGEKEDHVVWVKGSRAYEQNPLDFDKDGRTTKSEAARHVRRHYAEMITVMGE